jgi:membrane protease YdiL (CAAX protease family)
MSTTIERAPRAPGKLRTFLKEHGVATYYLLAIVISWVGVLLLVGRHGIPATPQESDESGGSAYMPMLLGPVVAGLLLIWLAEGNAGLRKLRASLARWRVGARWWVIAVFAIPFIAVATLLPLWAASARLEPEILATDENKGAFLVMGLVGGFLVGLFEEIGWTGFAIPRVRQRHGVITTGLSLGLVWGIWHLLLFVWDSGDESGAFDLSLLVPAFLFCLLVLPLARVLMVKVYEHTESVLVAAVMHASVTGVVAMILIPLDAKGWPLAGWYLLLSAVLAITATALIKQRSASPTGNLIVVPNTPAELVDTIGSHERAVNEGGA